VTSAVCTACKPSEEAIAAACISAGRLLAYLRARGRARPGLAAYPSIPTCPISCTTGGGRCRGTSAPEALQFLACTVHALWDKGADTPLIGPGDVDLGDEATHGASFS
jgi:hypothetical protein